MTNNELLEGLEIFKEAGYGDDSIAAEHDIIYGPGGDVLDHLMRERLESLDWFWDEECDSWCHFV